MVPNDPHGSLEALQGRRFSFYPAIRGIEHNEWTMHDSTWSEVQVRNGMTGQEFWIPKRHLGGVSSSDSPVLILGLQRELEFKAGGVYPYRRTVTEMPSTPASRQPPAASGARTQAATAVGLGRALGAFARHRHRRRPGGLRDRLLGAGGAFAQPPGPLAPAGYLHGGPALYRAWHDRQLLRGCGEAGQGPDSEEWISAEEDEIQFQALFYQARRYIVVLMGSTRGDMRYLGTLHDPSRQVLDSAQFSRGGDTGSMMRNLPEF